MLTEAFHRIGIRAEIVYTPTGSSLSDVNAGILDAEINRITGMEKSYPNLIMVPEPNMTMDFVAFSLQPFDSDGWESIRNLDIGLVRGWKILEDNTAGFPHVIRVPTEVELFTMLNKERLHIALYDRLTGYAVLRDLGIDRVHHLDPPLASRDMFLYVHEKHEGIVGSIALALREMKADGSYDAIMKQEN
jgi:polar amino acid transport system substrate-binding protein